MNEGRQANIFLRYALASLIFFGRLKMEQWDAYDKNFNKIKNRILIRGEQIPEGFFLFMWTIYARLIAVKIPLHYNRAKQLIING